MACRLSKMMMKNIHSLINFIKYFIFSEIIYLGFYVVKFYFKDEDIQNLYLGDNFAFAIFLILFILLIVSYYIFSKYISFNKISLKHIIYSQIILGLSLLFVWNISSNDLNTYIFTGRMMDKFSANPYVDVYDNYKDDIYYKELKTVWSDKITVYGPLTLQIGSVLSKFSFDSLNLNIYYYKIFFLTLSILNTYLIYKITKSVNSSFLYAFNPLINFEFFINSHNDILLCTFILFAIMCIKEKISINKSFLGSLSLIFGFLTKYLSIIFAPFIFLYIFVKQKNIKSKLNYSFFSILIGIIVIFIFYLPFESIEPLLLHFNSYSQAKLINPSILISFFENIYVFFGLNNGYFLAKKTSSLIFFSGYGIILLRFLQTLKSITFGKLLKIVLSVYLLFFATMFSSVNPWYFTSVLVLLIVYLSLSKKNFLSLHLLTFYSVCLYFIVR